MRPALESDARAVHIPRAQRPWLVIFDLDGTLIDSSQDLCRSVNAALEHVGASELSAELITSYVGDGASMLMQRALGEGTSAHIQETALQFFLEFYRLHKLDHTRAYPGVLDALSRLRTLAPGLPMAVLTNKPVRPSREICDALGLSPFFFTILGGDSLRTKKPHPEGLMHLIQSARALRVHDESDADRPVDRVVLVGDADVDVQTARHAGAKCLGCLYGLAPERLVESGPDIVCASPSEWLAKLGFTD